jgi:hypothetical protein
MIYECFQVSSDTHLVASGNTSEKFTVQVIRVSPVADIFFVSRLILLIRIPEKLDFNLG